MKHVGKLTIIGTLLKDVKTSCDRTMQGPTYLIKRRLFRWVLLHTYHKIARVVDRVVKVTGSWVTLDTPTPKIRVLIGGFMSPRLPIRTGNATRSRSVSYERWYKHIRDCTL